MRRNRGRQWRTLRAFILATHPNVCHLCGQTIDLSLPPTDPMAPEVDHIEPALHAPHRELDPTNLAPSHRNCNRKRGTNPIPAKASRTW